MHSKTKNSKVARSVRPNFIMAKEKEILNAAKILEMDYNASLVLSSSNNER